MPRDSSGVYTLPPGYEAVTGQTIEASQHNPPLEDLAAAMTGSLPRNGSAPMLAALNMAGSRVISVGTPTADTDAATKAYIDAAVAAVVAQIVAIPAGTVALWPGDTPPTGWLIGNGAAVSRTTYAGIFAAYGTKYGAGDGSTTFNLPDLRGEFLRFSDLGRGLDAGRVNGSLQTQDVQSHSHGVNDPGHSHSSPDGLPFQTVGGGSFFLVFGGGSQNSFQVASTTVNATGISIQAAGGAETRPRNIALIGIIKT